nr:putative ribonuclease H-like domain-containing protein [Tanacetum cinerariifolium]
MTNGREMTPPPSFSTPPHIPNVNTNERPPVTPTVFAATTPGNTPFAYDEGFKEVPNREGSITGRNIEGKRPSEAGVEENGRDQEILKHILFPFISSNQYNSQQLLSQEKEASDSANALRKEFEQGCMDQRGVTQVGSTNSFNTVSNPVNAASTSGTFSAGGPSSPYPDAFIPANTLLHVNQDDSQLRDLKETAKLQSTDHPKDQILGDPKSAVQTRSMAKKSSEAHAFMEPKKVSQALDDESWVEAIQEELLQFSLQKVWRLVDLPYGKKAIRTKWVYRNKKDERGIIVRNKAKLVAQGHIQEERIDYDEIFAPMARIEAIRIFLAFATFMGFIVYQMDVKSTFLYGTIEEEVYVSQPSGFIDPQFPNKVYKVKKALYGLHQAPSVWELTFFLELQVKQSEEGIFISQDKYVADILKKFDFSSLKTASTPIETHKPLVKDEVAADIDVHLYRSMIGSLMYLTASRPDIMFALLLESWARHGALSSCNCHLSLTGSFFFFSSIAVQTFGSGISYLLAVATIFTGSGNLYCQWELLTWQWECLVHFILKILP